MADSSESRKWAVLGLALTRQTVALVLAAVSVSALVGLAVLNWLENAA